MRAGRNVIKTVNFLDRPASYGWRRRRCAMGSIDAFFIGLIAGFVLSLIVFARSGHSS